MYGGGKRAHGLAIATMRRWSLVLVMAATVDVWGAQVAHGCPMLATNEVGHRADCDHRVPAKPTAASSVTPYAVYYKEHEVSAWDARQAFANLAPDAGDEVPAWCDECDADALHYCRSMPFINDHCCCEHSHAREELPWIPHTCYLGEERCLPNAGSCGKYRALKECCCVRLLRQEYNDRYSGASGRASPDRIGSTVHLLAVTLTFVVTCVIP